MPQSGKRARVEGDLSRVKKQKFQKTSEENKEMEQRAERCRQRRALRRMAREKWLSLDSAEDLIEVENLLRASSAPMGSFSCTNPEARVTAASTAHETEVEGDEAAERQLSLQALCLLLCQQERGNAEAAKIMLESKMVARLSREVLFYSTRARVGYVSNPAQTPLRMFDEVLSPTVLSMLQEVFCPANANYWTAHSYSVFPPSPYFSYVVDLTEGRDLGVLGNLIGAIAKLTGEHFGGAESARFAEIWAHRRPHTSGHQLHFDSDDEGVGGVRNPLVSTVLYLSDEGCGGPTLVTDQYQDSESLAQNGWLAFPRKNRLVIFDGAVLHGVVPGRGYVDRSQTRTTLMVALWDEIKVRHGQTPGAARPFPDPQDTLPRWFSQLTRKVTATVGGREKSPARVLVSPVRVSNVWTDLNGNSCTGSKPHYNHVFQGF